MPKAREKNKRAKVAKPSGDHTLPATILRQNEVPAHLFNIPELDFSADLFAERCTALWFRLGAWTKISHRDHRGIEDEVMRQSVLLPPTGFTAVFDRFDSVGEVFQDLGKPSNMIIGDQTGGRRYNYAPFHRFDVHFTPVHGESLVFLHRDTSGVHLFINPDLWLFLELVERAPGAGIWWEPRTGVDILVHRAIDGGSLEIVEVRTGYLLKYLQARQMSLVVGQYRQLLLFNPTQSAIRKFVEGDLTLGTAEHGAKVILQNWGQRRGHFGRDDYLQRRAHIWFEIKPPAVDTDDPWAEEPSFDPYTFTFQTQAGAVAPARWKEFRAKERRKFKGATCDFMDRVYFRQEVLTKYEGAAGFDVKDDASVSCRHYWSLDRSTARLGNELLSTAIGDFAEGVPFEEWPHWSQYVIEPPSSETAKTIAQETPIPAAVNSLGRALNQLNAAFIELSTSIGVTIDTPLWRATLDSPAGRQLKWVYLSTADDNEFLKRAMLTSTFVNDALQSKPLRALLTFVDANLHKNFENPPQTLGSRNLLQRVTLVALLISNLRPELTELLALIKQAEGKAKNTIADLQVELEKLCKQIRDEFAPLAFLYDLRTHGGLAHPPNKEEAAIAAAKLGLPKGNWHRTDYLRMLELITSAINRITEHLEAAADSPFA
jgi:hypothetical protein